MRLQHFLCDFVLTSDAAALVAGVTASCWGLSAETVPRAVSSLAEIGLWQGSTQEYDLVGIAVTPLSIFVEYTTFQYKKY